MRVSRGDKEMGLHSTVRRVPEKRRSIIPPDRWKDTGANPVFRKISRHESQVPYLLPGFRLSHLARSQDAVPFGPSRRIAVKGIAAGGRTAGRQRRDLSPDGTRGGHDTLRRILREPPRLHYSKMLKTKDLAVRMVPWSP